jgi:hypothetical protein
MRQRAVARFSALGTHRTVPLHPRWDFFMRGNFHLEFCVSQKSQVLYF